MKIFVTGGNGFLGSRTLNELIQNGHQVRCLIRQESNLDRIKHLPFESHLGDIRDLESLIKGSSGCDAIVHLACVSSWSQIREQSHRLEDTVVNGTRNVLEAASINQISRMVYISSCAAVNASKIPKLFNEKSKFTLLNSSLKYSIAKHKAEKVVQSYVKNKDLDAVIVNPCEIYGENDDGMITAGNLVEVLKGLASVVCSGGTSVAHVDDIARGIRLALEKGKKGERYILGGENLTIAELTKMVRRLGKKSNSVFTLSNRILIPICKGLEKLGMRSPFPIDLLDYAVLYWFVDSTKAKTELGYHWRSAEQTFSEVIPWLLSTQRVT